MSAHPNPQPDPRVGELEEQLAFAERDRDRLREEATELSRQLVALEHRLARLEDMFGTLSGRMNELVDRGVERPPHAAGPAPDPNP